MQRPSFFYLPAWDKLEEITPTDTATYRKKQYSKRPCCLCMWVPVRLCQMRGWGRLGTGLTVQENMSTQAQSPRSALVSILWSLPPLFVSQDFSQRPGVH